MTLEQYRMNWNYPTSMRVGVGRSACARRCCAPTRAWRRYR
jgi:hypothetical protein